jgi:hypothetical protein
MAGPYQSKENKYRERFGEPADLKFKLNVVCICSQLCGSCLSLQIVHELRYCSSNGDMRPTGSTSKLQSMGHELIKKLPLTF